MKHGGIFLVCAILALSSCGGNSSPASGGQSVSAANEAVSAASDEVDITPEELLTALGCMTSLPEQDQSYDPDPGRCWVDMEGVGPQIATVVRFFPSEGEHQVWVDYAMSKDCLAVDGLEWGFLTCDEGIAAAAINAGGTLLH